MSSFVQPAKLAATGIKVRLDDGFQDRFELAAWLLGKKPSTWSRELMTQAVKEFERANPGKLDLVLSQKNAA